jgi:translation initiation factor 2B subunit (eIF-2B alpha/beta/delta family)
VVYADRALVEHAVAKVYDGDVVLTYALSSVVLEVLLQAHARGRRFRVVVLDSRPELEGRQLLRRLMQVRGPGRRALQRAALAPACRPAPLAECLP